MTVRWCDLRAWCAALVVLGAATEADATLPSRAWGTYVGGDSSDQTYAAAVDAQGYVYVVGVSASQGLATAGAHKTAPEGQDALLVKYTADGTPLWGTYIGGTGLDAGWALAVRDGVVVIAGVTQSAEGIATPGTFQAEYAGPSFCGFVVAFTTEGARQWGTYVCAPGQFHFSTSTRIAIDAQGAVYFCGDTRGTIPGLTTPASYQPNYLGNGVLGDTYLAKLDAQGSLLWGTYYGGIASEHAEGLSINSLGEIYISGTTSSPTGFATPGAHKTSGDDYDSFLARFTADGERMWGTYYGGALEDSTTHVTALPQGGAVIAGQTASSEGIATPGAHQPNHAGGFDSYLARFDAEGKRIWGTYHGGPDQEASDNEITTDVAGNLYLVHVTTSLTGLASEDAWQTQSNGEWDLSVSSFDSDGARRWGTYYGGSGHELTVGIATSPTADVYLVGETRSSDGIASRGAHDTSLGGVADGFLVRLDSATFGAPCAGPGDCKDGTCVDAVCCATACGGGVDDCQVCAASEGASEDGTCTLLGADVLCRAADGMCDLAEHCAGAEACPDDVMAADGEACPDGICQAGQCAAEVDVSSGSGDVPTTSDSSTSDSSTSDSSTSDSSTSGASTPTGGPITGGGPGSTGLESSTGAATTDAAVDGADGCGCRGTPVSSGPAGLLAAVLLLRRRRR